MQKTLGALYEDGLFRPLEPVRLPERQRVSLTIGYNSPGLEDDDVLDLEFLSGLDGENLPEVPLETLQAALAKIPGSMSDAFIAEREERF